MTAQNEIEYLHEDLAELVKANLGKGAIVCTVVSTNERREGQWVLCHPDQNKVIVGERLTLCGKILANGCEATAKPEEQRDFLADAMRKALKHLDAIDLDAYFAEATKENPHPWVRALMAMHDELRPALNVVGLDYHKSDS
jgi:hypothetical protein